MAERTPPPNLTDYSAGMRRLLELARWLTPEEGKEWLEDMLLELPFVPPAERRSWAWGALGLALDLRLNRLTVTRPALLAFSSVALTVAVLALVVLPNRNPTLPNAKTANAEHEAAATVDSVSLLHDSNTVLDEAGTAGMSGLNQVVSSAEPATATAEPETNASADAVAATPAAQPQTVQPQAVPPNATGVAAILESPAEPAPSVVEDASQPGTEAVEASVATRSGSDMAEVMTGAETATRQSNYGATAPVNADTPSPNTLYLTATDSVYIEVYRGEVQTAEALVLKRTLSAGESLRVDPPALLYTTNAGSLELSQDNQPRPLGEPGATLLKQFPLP